MRDILSLRDGTIVVGKEINAWCLEQIVNHLPDENDARRIMLKKSYKNFHAYEKNTGYFTHLVEFIEI